MTETRRERWTRYCEMEAMAHDMERCAARMRLVAVDSNTVIDDEAKAEARAFAQGQIDHHQKMADEYRAMAGESRLSREAA